MSNYWQPLGEDMIHKSGSLAFWNAVDFALLLFAFLLMVLYIKRNTHGLGDLKGRLQRAMSIRFQGGPYDLVVALAVIMLGRVIRSETAWDARFFDIPLRGWQFALGAAVTAVGIICLIRIMSTSPYFNYLSMVCAVLAVAFGIWSAS